MAKIITNNNPQEVFKKIMKENIQREVLIIETDLKKLDKKFIDKFSKYYPWHFKDSMRSFFTAAINNPKYEFSYFKRMTSHFSTNQIANAGRAIKNSPKHAVISMWDPKIDCKNDIIPCFMNLYIKNNKGELDFTVVFRARDLIRRLMPNWNALNIMQQDFCETFGLKQGKLTDISIDCFMNSQDRIKIEPLVLEIDNK